MELKSLQLVQTQEVLFFVEKFSEMFKSFETSNLKSIEKHNASLIKNKKDGENSQQYVTREVFLDFIKNLLEDHCLQIYGQQKLAINLMQTKQELEILHAKETHLTEMESASYFFDNHFQGTFLFSSLCFAYCDKFID